MNNVLIELLFFCVSMYNNNVYNVHVLELYLYIILFTSSIIGPNNGNSIFSMGIFGVIAITVVVSAIVLIVCLFCISKTYKKRQHYHLKSKTTGQYTNTIDLNSSNTHLVQSNVLNNASFQVQVNQSYDQFTNTEVMNIPTEHYVQPHNEVPLVTTNPIYTETPNNTSHPTPDEITTDPVYSASNENYSPVYIEASQGIPSPLNSPLPMSTTTDNSSYSETYMVVFESPNIESQGYITPVPIYEEI